MNFKGNTFSLGGGDLISGRISDDGGEARIFISRNQVISMRRFWHGTRKIDTGRRNASFADACFLISGGRLAEFRNSRLTVTEPDKV